MFLAGFAGDAAVRFVPIFCRHVDVEVFKVSPGTGFSRDVVVGTVSVFSAMLVLSGTFYASVYGVQEFIVFLREKVHYGS